MGSKRNTAEGTEIGHVMCVKSVSLGPVGGVVTYVSPVPPPGDAIASDGKKRYETIHEPTAREKETNIVVAKLLRNVLT